MSCRSSFRTWLSLLFFLIIGSGHASKFLSPHKKINQEDANFFKFRTRPDIKAPKWDIKVYHADALSKGYWFIGPYESLEQVQRGSPWVGPYIYDKRGELVWSGAPMLDHYKSFDLKVSTISGHDVLTVIYPHDNAGLVLDSSYQIQKRVIWGEDYDHSNMHDFNVVKNGTRALVLTKEKHATVSREMSAVVGYDGNCTVRADGLKEMDITTSETKALFSWKGIDHIGLDETTFHPHSIKQTCDNGWDIHHFNSIDEFPDGDYLLSSRHTSTLYKISHIDGSIVWRLGGVKSDFKFDHMRAFTRQHHARVHQQNDTHAIITVFDNAKGTGPNEVASRRSSAGLMIRLNMNTMKADLVGKFNHPHGGITNSRGAMQILPNGNALMCWAYHTLISEHAPNGKLLMEARLKRNIHTYRAYKFKWTGHPLAPPNVYSAAFVAGSDTSTMVYVSWNGATEVARWNLYQTNMNGQGMNLINSTSRWGFETELTYEGFAKYVVAEALDRHNISISRSAVVHTIPAVEETGESVQNEHPLESGVKEVTTPVQQAANSRPNHNEANSENVTKGIIVVLETPTGAFITGFVSCATICAVFWIVSKYSGLSWLRLNLTGYQRLEQNKQGELESAEHASFDEKYGFRPSSFELDSP